MKKIKTSRRSILKAGAAGVAAFTLGGAPFVHAASKLLLVWLGLECKMPFGAQVINY